MAPGGTPARVPIPGAGTESSGSFRNLADCEGKMGPGSLFGALKTLFAYAALRVLSLSGRG